MTEEFYSYGCFRFTREQIVWVLAHRDCFDKGEWPPMPDEFLTDAFVKEGKRGEWVKVLRKKSTFIDAPITKRQIMSKSYFENPMTILAEIGTRLLKTGKDGRDLYKQIKIAFDSGGTVDYDDLVEDAQDALDYMSGWGRKKSTYVKWKKGHHYYQKYLERSVMP